MKVEEGKIITLEYTITTDKGEMIESSAGTGKPLVFPFGQSGLLPGVDEAIRGMESGEDKEITLSPEKAIGEPKTWPTMEIKKTQLPEGAETKVGSMFEAAMAGNQNVKFAVLEDRVNDVLVRLIPPLAGKTLVIKVKVTDVKEAS